MNALLVELRRRKVLRVAGAYLLTSWLILQVAEILVPALQLPDWALSLVLLLLGLGFPIALVCAWAIELTPDGVRLEREATHRISGQGLAGTALAAALLAAIAGYQAHAFATLRADDESRNDGPHPGHVAVAVLPIESLSQEADELAEGLTVELLNALSNTGRTRVVARSSSYALRDSGSELREVGRRLNADFLIEGCIREFSGSLRVTVHLVSATSGYRVRSQTLDVAPSHSLHSQQKLSEAIVEGLRGWI